MLVGGTHRHAVLGYRMPLRASGDLGDIAPTDHTGPFLAISAHGVSENHPGGVRGVAGRLARCIAALGESRLGRLW